MLRKRDKSFSQIESLIANGVTIKGNIISQGSMRVDGFVDGKMDIKGDLVIGENGHVKGELQAENAMLAGKVEGALIARQRCLITETGLMMGDVTCSVLSIEEGGTLHGASKMNYNKNSSDILLSDKTDNTKDHSKHSRNFKKSSEAPE